MAAVDVARSDGFLDVFWKWSQQKLGREREKRGMKRGGEGEKRMENPWHTHLSSLLGP